MKFTKHWFYNSLFRTALIVLAASVSLQAQDVMRVGSASGKVGVPAEIGVFLQDVPGTLIDTIDGKFDGFFTFNTILTFDSQLVDAIEVVPAGITAIATPTFFFDLSSLEDGKIGVFAVYFNNRMPITLGGSPPGDLLCHFRLTPSPAAAGQSIEFTYQDTDISTTGFDEKPRLLESQGTLSIDVGSITVAGNPPVINSFDVSPPMILQGETATLSWDVDGADSVTLSSFGSVSASGNQSVSPRETTTYFLTAENDFGTVDAQVTLDVEAIAPPEIVSFTVESDEILEGQATMLSWNVTGADQVTISQGLGDVAASGNATITPANSTTYTLTASNGGGTVNAMVEVTVFPLMEIVFFSVSPNQILAGQTAELSWAVRNSDTVTLDPGNQDVGQAATLVVQPGETTVYTLSATGPLGQTDQRQVQLIVTGEPSLSLNTSSVNFSHDGNNAEMQLAVNTDGSFQWAVGNVPEWLMITPESGSVDMENPAAITIEFQRNHLFPGQNVTGQLSFSAEGLLATELSLSGLREKDRADETHLYYPLLEADGTKHSEITAVNLGENAADLLLLIFSADGSLNQPPVEATLAARGNHRLVVDTLGNDTGWAVATLKSRVEGTPAPSGTGAVSVRSEDGEELYGLGVSRGLSEFLFVPHVAKDTASFFTKGSVINLDNQPRIATGTVKDLLGTDTGQFNLGVQGVGEQTFFDFETLLGDDIANADWGRIEFDETQSAGAMGAEVFGFAADSRTVGVGIDQQLSNELYFVHIARDLSSFWTGIVVTNASDQAAEVQFEPYNFDRELIDGGFTQMFEPGEKRTYVVIEGRLDFGEDASWVKVTSPQPLIGYELFANPASSIGQQFAGLESIGTLSQKLAFPHTENGLVEGGFTAVAVLNPQDETANLTYALVSSSGVVKATIEDSLLPKEKRAVLASQLFAEEMVSAGDIILVSANLEIAGFELYGTPNKTMGALLAAPY